MVRTRTSHVTHVLLMSLHVVLCRKCTYTRDLIAHALQPAFAYAHHIHTANYPRQRIFKKKDISSTKPKTMSRQVSKHGSQTSGAVTVLRLTWSWTAMCVPQGNTRRRNLGSHSEQLHMHERTDRNDGRPPAATSVMKNCWVIRNVTRNRPPSQIITCTHSPQKKNSSHAAFYPSSGFV